MADAVRGPLQGKRVVVTRAEGQADEMTALLAGAGALPVAVPTIAIAPPESWSELDAALAAIPSFTGCIFTSVNGVEGFFGRAAALQLEPRPAPGAWICAVGPATAAALARHPGWAATITPARALAEGVVAALAGLPLEGKRVLLARAATGRDVIPAALTRLGAEVSVAATHRTLPARDSAPLARSLFPGADAAVFTSSSTAQNLCALLGEDYRERLRGTVLVALGPITRATLEQLGLAGALEAGEASPAAVVQALIEHWAAPHA